MWAVVWTNLAGFRLIYEKTRTSLCEKASAVQFQHGTKNQKLTFAQTKRNSAQLRVYCLRGPVMKYIYTRRDDARCARNMLFPYPFLLTHYYNNMKAANLLRVSLEKLQ